MLEDDAKLKNEADRIHGDIFAPSPRQTRVCSRTRTTGTLVHRR